MNTKQVATQYARKFMVSFQYIINWGLILLISALMFIISCAKSDEIEKIVNESPENNEPPIVYEPIIIYTDIDPDFTSENLNDFYNLDLNNDQIVDFTLKSIYYPGYNWDDLIVSSYYDLNISSTTNYASGIISVTPWYSNPIPLDSGNEIFNLSGYTNGETYENWGSFIIGNCEDEGSCYQDWKDKNDKYLGLRFPKNGKIYYGWLRLDVTSPTQWVIKDYAYNATPNKPIVAGQKE